MFRQRRGRRYEPNLRGTTPRAYDALGIYMAASAVADAIPLPFIVQVWDDIDFPQRYRWIFAPIKAAAAAGMLSVRWFPGLARLTSGMLTLYFVLAVGFHVKARDISLAAGEAAMFAAIFGAMTVKSAGRQSRMCHITRARFVLGGVGRR